jgi:pachytene checkpoint protein 2
MTPSHPEETLVSATTTTTTTATSGGGVMMDVVAVENDDDLNKENYMPNNNDGVVRKVSPFTGGRRSGPIHVEVEIHPMCPTPLSQLRQQWQSFLASQTAVDDDTRPLLFFQNQQNNEVKDPSNSDDNEEPVDDTIYMDRSFLPHMLLQTCVGVRIERNKKQPRKDKQLRTVEVAPLIIRVYPYILSTEEASTEEIDPSSTGGAAGSDEEWTAACDVLPLPHASLNGLWDNLVFDPSIKTTLLEYAQSALLFSDRAVSSHVVSWNRILLLYGPAGTGKTSLCRALAHKLAIRMGHRFSRGTTLLEVHSHSLFSKWFSTSGKLVSALFQLIRDMVQDDPEILVCVLIDEVESLAAVRGGDSGSNGGGDPADAMRAVNSLLTSLDRLRAFPNVLVLATTNLTNSVDAAFLDRADLKLHIGMPILQARYEILRSCLLELERVGIIEMEGTTATQENNLPKGGSSALKLPGFPTALRWQQQQTQSDPSRGSQQPDDFVMVAAASRLLECAQQAHGLSGRSLRRLPLQAHAQYLHGSSADDCCTLNDFLEGLAQAIQTEHAARSNMMAISGP